MDSLVDFLTGNAMLITFVILLLGSLLGAVRIGGVPIGPAAVLFVAIGMSAYDEALAIPPVLKDFGMVLFAYTIGIGAGAAFISGFKSNLKPLAALTGAIAIVAGVAWGMGALLGIDEDGAYVPGIFAGGTTNTPSLGAAQELLADTPYATDPTVGYSISYLWGVVGMILAVAWVMARSVGHPTPEDSSPPPRLASRTVRVTSENLPTLGEIQREIHGDLLFTRYRHEGEVALATQDVRLAADDLVTFTGPEPAVVEAAELLGVETDEHLPLDRRTIDYRRMTVSDRHFNGQTLKSLELRQKYGAVAVRVRRGDVDMLATDDFVLQSGDRIRVAAPREKLPEVAKYLGDSERGGTDMNPVGFMMGVVIGILVGSIEIPIGFGTLSLGNAAGPLVVGLVLGYVGHIGRVRFLVPNSANQTLNQIGMLLFLAGVGGSAGASFVEALQTGLGGPLLLGGFVVTTTFALLLILIGRPWLGMAAPRLAGFIAGAQTQPGVLAYAQERSNDSRVALGYATAFAGATIVKVILIQLLSMPYVE